MVEHALGVDARRECARHLHAERGAERFQTRQLERQRGDDAVRSGIEPRIAGEAHRSASYGQLIEAHCACGVAPHGASHRHRLAEKRVAGCDAGPQPLGRAVETCREPGCAFARGIGGKPDRAGERATGKSGERPKIGDR